MRVRDRARVCVRAATVTTCQLLAAPLRAPSPSCVGSCLYTLSLNGMRIDRTIAAFVADA
jgi:hypothetical protein